MVRTSLRSEHLQQLQAKVRARTSAYMRSLLADDEEGEDDSDDDFRDEMLLIDTALYLSALQQLKSAIRSRYLTRAMYRRYSNSQFGDDIEADDGSFLNPNEFLQKYRMKRTSFDKLLSLIKDHPIFKKYVHIDMLSTCVYCSLPN
jgi:hypothetical protein